MQIGLVRAVLVFREEVYVNTQYQSNWFELWLPA